MYIYYYSICILCSLSVQDMAGFSLFSLIFRNSDSMLEIILLKVIVVHTEGQIWGGLVGLVKNALQNIRPWKVHSGSLEKCQQVGHTLGRGARSFPHCPLLGEFADCFPQCVLPKQSIQPFGIGLLSEANWLEQILLTMLPLGIDVEKKTQKTFSAQEPLCGSPLWTKHFRTERPPHERFLSTDVFMPITTVNKTNSDFL